MRTDDITAESTEVAIRDANNEALADSLINGQLGAGLTPATRAATEAGEKDLLECLNGEVEKIKTKTNKGEKTEKAEPATLEEILVFKKRHQVINQYNHQSPFIIS